LLVAASPLSPSDCASDEALRDRLTASENSLRRRRMSARLMSAFASAVVERELRAMASASCIAASSRAGRSRSSITADSAIRALTIAYAHFAASATLYAARLAASASGAFRSSRCSTESW
jgi:hypothetical protein